MQVKQMHHFLKVLYHQQTKSCTNKYINIMYVHIYKYDSINYEMNGALRVVQCKTFTTVHGGPALPLVHWGEVDIQISYKTKMIKLVQ